MSNRILHSSLGLISPLLAESAARGSLLPIMASMPQWELPHTKVEQAHRSVGLLNEDFHVCIKNQEQIFKMSEGLVPDINIILHPCKCCLQRYEIEMRKDALFHILLVFLAFFSYICSGIKL